ncbi:hypothetical protein SAMN05444161_5681 [Rhizobiales bacterium GAS191]|nr:hypothetical protein SAMN05519103_04877 [Rhizobiales bacterium GAS113]SEE41192.1 hypothetical protein SAMN05444161_5681 [Rhizobiales bacterium GAS191]
MERSEGVTATLASIMKMMDRSNGRLLSAVSDFQGANKRIQATPKAARPVTPVRVDQNTGHLSAAAH